jgi:transposase
MISAEQRAEIRRLFYAEHWKVGTIASALGVHPDTVRRAIETEHFAASARPRPSQVDPFLPFIRETLQRYPRLRSTRLLQMLRDRGYHGSVQILRKAVQRLRPVGTPEAYLRLRTMPAEQAQVDWGSFGWVGTGRSRRPLSCFVMVLSWSRAIHASFTLDQTLESFMRGHIEAFEYYGGVPRIILYDNLKSVVLERRGDAIRFHPRLLELCGHYHFAPRPVSPARGNEKGRVERQIQFLRTSFFAARPFRNVDDLNAQFGVWREQIAHQRLNPGDQTMTVEQALDRERALMLPLPQHRFETDVVRVVSSGKTPYVRYDRNLYSIPHRLVRRSLTLIASRSEVRIQDGQTQVARHDRSYGTAEVIEDPAHIEGLVRCKKAARELKGRDRLRASVPESDQIFEALALRGGNLGGHTSRLLKLLDDYGVEELRVAVIEALGREAYGAGSIAHILEQRRRSRGLAPPARVDLPDDPRVRDLRVIPHRLEDYDALGHDEHDGNNDQNTR